ncbi:DNA polymerase III subunit alpha [Buchnera aphidicola (Ceratoglyphina bambusae)]|uniref:DNA polymerase III subunit alpha n=1 Tax=Buchnera aphidicola TaxID=9 RepID=UPI0031B867CE
MKNFEFVHLNVHSEYSIINGFNKPKDIIKKACKFNMPSLCLSDLGNMFGALKFYEKSHIFGIKPILGLHLKIVFVKNDIEIILLARNILGYKNLMIISSILQNNNMNKVYKFNRIHFSYLKKYSKGLILILSYNFFYKNYNNIVKIDYKLIEEYILFFKKNFCECFYLELNRIGLFNEEFYINKILKVSFIYEIPLVATNRVYFLNKEDFNLHKIKTCINKGISLSKLKNYKYTKNQFLKSKEEMYNIFIDIPESIKNSVEISKRCNVLFEEKKYFLPNFFKKKVSSKRYLIKKSYEGIKKRLKKISKNKNFKNKNYSEYYKRISYELKIINKMGFSGYFLIVMEFILWAKKNDIPVGPGRGSGAGSLVAYALCITEINPIDFDLLFERFLNPERLSMPDFDVDFCMDRRDEVVSHISKIYGKKYVSQIITFGTMSAKSVIRDVGRVLGYPYGFINYVSKLIPTHFRMTIKKAFIEKLELRALYKNDEEFKNLIDISKKLEGVIKNVGKHSGGIIISPNKIINYVPLYFDKECNNSITQFDKNDLENIGLIKFDLLGLRTLTLIQSTILLIKKNNKKNFKNINEINLNDNKVFKLFKNSNTTAIFQLESKGMKDLIRKLLPDSFEDIIALVALFRPGPLQSGMVDNFINRKHGVEKTYYPDKNWQNILLKPILKSTYGIILYQEQVMKIVQVLAGYTLGRADIFRRAMSKKNNKEMKKQKEIFINGARKNKIDKIFAEKIFNLLEKFSGYGFNKSHSAAYAMITYQTMWLKTYYPSEFIVSAINLEMDKTGRLITLIDECRKMKIKIISPNINYSFYKFIIFDNNIIYGLGAIKGIGISSIQIIIDERKKNGVFKNLLDLCIRTIFKKITFNVYKKLIFSGACDCFKLDRYILYGILKNIIKLSLQNFNNKNIICKRLFNTIKEDYKNIIMLHKKKEFQWTLEEKLKKEHSSLGLYLTSHPVFQYYNELKYYKKIIKIKKLYKNKFINQTVSVIGIIFSIRSMIYKNNKKIIYIILDDFFHKIEIVIFNNLVNKYNSLLKKQKIILVKGKIVFDNFINNIRLIAKDINTLEKLRKKNIKKIIIFLDMNIIKKNIKKNIFKIIKENENGKIPLKIYENNLKNKKIYNFKKKTFIYPNNKLFNQLDLFLGKNFVKIFIKK